MQQLLLLLTAVSVSATKDQLSPPTFPGLPSMSELASNGGSRLTDILVTTEDGYILFMHRIGNNTGPPVLVQHGIFNAADIWISRGTNEDLVFLLLEEGYDVYLGNQRGNAFALDHVRYGRQDPRFWDYSFHEGGFYDLPAMIDKILELRKVDQVFYIGYSLGTTVFFVMTSARPEYNDKIKAAVLLAPVAYGPPLTELHVLPLRLLIHNHMIIVDALSSSRWYEILPRTASSIRAAQELCDVKSPMIDVCLDIVGMMLGEHRSNVDRETFGYHLSFSPAGSSLKTLHHLGQNYRRSEFNFMDYGEMENLRRYNSTSPPAYNISQITCPVALFWGRNDNLISESTVKRVAALLPNLLIEHPISDPLFTHIDVVMGMNAKEVLYLPVIQLMNSVRNGRSQ